MVSLPGAETLGQDSPTVDSGDAGLVLAGGMWLPPGPLHSGCSLSPEDAALGCQSSGIRGCRAQGLVGSHMPFPWVLAALVQCAKPCPQALPTHAPSPLPQPMPCHACPLPVPLKVPGCTAVPCPLHTPLVTTLPVKASEKEGNSGLRGAQK